MKDISGNFLAGILAVYDFADRARIVDLGGGSGTLLAAIPHSVPGARGVLFDIAPVVASAEPVVQAAGIADRCETVAGDFFDQVPPGGDLYILSNIIPAVPAVARPASIDGGVDMMTWLLALRVLVVVSALSGTTATPCASCGRVEGRSCAARLAGELRRGGPSARSVSPMRAVR